MLPVLQKWQTAQLVHFFYNESKAQSGTLNNTNVLYIYVPELDCFHLHKAHAVTQSAHQLFAGTGRCCGSTHNIGQDSNMEHLE